MKLRGSEMRERVMLVDGIYRIGDGMLDIDEDYFKGLLVLADDINEIYDVEQTPFARGKFAAVRRAVHKNSGVHFAAKFLKRRRRAQSSDKEIKHEIAVLMLCKDSENIVKLNAVHESRSDTALLLDLAVGGELQTLLDQEESLSEAEARICMREVLKALHFLHKRSVAHLDLKPQNILLTGQRIEDGLKLCDFGISRMVAEGTNVREIIGTPDYVAPEVLQYEPLSLLTDIWSVGVLAYVLLSGFSPFGGETKQETFLNISQCSLTFPDKLFNGVSAVAIDFIRNALRIKPKDRMTAADCLEHVWLRDDCKLVRHISNVKNHLNNEKINNNTCNNVTGSPQIQHLPQSPIRELQKHQQANRTLSIEEEEDDRVEAAILDTTITTNNNYSDTNKGSQRILQQKSPKCIAQKSDEVDSTKSLNLHLLSPCKKDTIDPIIATVGCRQQAVENMSMTTTATINMKTDVPHNMPAFRASTIALPVPRVRECLSDSKYHRTGTLRIGTTKILAKQSHTTPTNLSAFNIPPRNKQWPARRQLSESNKENSILNFGQLLNHKNNINHNVAKSPPHSSPAAVISPKTSPLSSQAFVNATASITVTVGANSPGDNSNTNHTSNSIFPDAPTTPKVIRKTPNNEIISPTSVKALVKKFQLDQQQHQHSEDNPPTSRLLINNSTSEFVANNDSGGNDSDVQECNNEADENDNNTNSKKKMSKISNKSKDKLSTTLPLNCLTKTNSLRRTASARASKSNGKTQQGRKNQQVNRPDNSLNRASKVVTNKTGCNTTYRRSDQANELNCCHFETIPANTKYTEVVIDLMDTKTYSNNIKTDTSLITKCLSSANEPTMTLTLSSPSPSNDPPIENTSPINTPSTATALSSSPSSCSLKQLRHHSKSFHPNFPHHHHHHLLKTSPAGANSANNALTASNLDQGVIC